MTRSASSPRITTVVGPAHENDTAENVMCQTGEAASPTWQQVDLDATQDDTVTNNCMVAK